MAGENIITWVIMAILALAFGFVALLLSSPMTELITGLTNNTGINDTNSQTFVNETSNSIVPIFDNIAFWFMVAILGSVIIMGLYLKWHPVIIILAFVFLIIIIFQFVQYANLYDELVNSDELSQAQNHTLSNIIFGKQLPLIVGVLGALALLVIFKNKGGGQNDI